MVAIEDIPIFSVLDRNRLRRLKDALHIKQFAKGNVVFFEGETSDQLHILLDGSVKVYKTSPKGNQIQINRFHAPSLVAEFALFEREPFPATCEFVTDGVMGFLAFNKLYELLSVPEFSVEMIRSLTKKISLLSALVHKETILSSEAKVADLMLKKVTIFHRLKNNEIASILNLTPETFSRILTKFKKNGFIKIENHKLHILNHDALIAIVENNTIKTCMNCITDFKAKTDHHKT